MSRTIPIVEAIEQSRQETLLPTDPRSNKCLNCVLHEHLRQHEIAVWDVLRSAHAQIKDHEALLKKIQDDVSNLFAATDDTTKKVDGLVTVATKHNSAIKTLKTNSDLRNVRLVRVEEEREDPIANPTKTKRSRVETGATQQDI